MAFDLQPFMQNISNYGVVPSSKYDVSITLPPIIQAQASNSDLGFINAFTNIMPFRAISCTPPAAVMMSTSTTKWGFGPRIKQPYSVAYQDVRLTLLGDTEAVIESFGHYWMNMAYNHSYSPTSTGTFMTNFRGDIASKTVQINKYDRTGANVSSYILSDCMPTLFIASPLGWDQSDDLTKFTLQLNYTSFDII